MFLNCIIFIIATLVSIVIRFLLLHVVVGLFVDMVAMRWQLSMRLGVKTKI